MQKRLFGTLILAASLLACHTRAEAAERLTNESCRQYLTTDPAGPRLNPDALRVESMITIDGVQYRVYSGMLLDDICALAARRSEELASRDDQIAELTGTVSSLEKQGKADANFRKNAENDIVRNHAYLFIILALTPFLLVLLNKLLRYARSNARRRRSSGRFSSSRSRSIG